MENSEIILYQTADGATKVEVRMEGETIWAAQRLREYITKGFALDDERLKRAGQMNYFDELLSPHPGHSEFRKGVLPKTPITHL